MDGWTMEDGWMMEGGGWMTMMMDGMDQWLRRWMSDRRMGGGTMAG